MPTKNDVPYQSSHELTPYIRGACELTVQQDGLVLPRRFFPEQTAHFDAIGRGERAIATAGIVVELVTDGTEVYLDCNVVRPLNPNHALYEQVMAGGANDGAPPFGSAEEGNVDGIDIVVDGRMLATVAPMTGTLRFAFENSTHEDIEVRIYLPSIMAVSIGNLRTNGSMKPVPERGYLLALGDSITQGFICGNPSAAYPAQIAKILGLDLLNQAVAGHVFDEDSLGGFSRWRDETPELIVVAYGTNDWAHKRSAEAIEQDAVAYLDRLSRMFPKVPTYVLSPLWRTDEHEPKPCGFPLTWMNQVLGRACSRHPNMHVVDGYHGIPKDPDLYADASVHPGPECMGLVADLLLEAMCADSVDLTVARHVQKRTNREAARFVSGFVSREELIDRDTAQRAESPETHPEFDRVVRTIWRLRQGDGCPWDREQTHESITRNMVEEAYEVVEAIREGDNAHLAEELGDVLMQVLLHAQISDDAGSFDIDDVCRLLNEKLVRRHPHVFGDEVSSQASSSEEVLQIWDEVKKGEVDEGREGLLDSVPRSLPALMQAQKISRRAAKAGFEWDTLEDIWCKVREERDEFEREEIGSEAAAEEFGDMLFALVNVARRCGIDAEEALAASNDKFRRRWKEMERRDDVGRLDTSGLNRLWDEVKHDIG
jgi:MazG family protein